MSWLHGLADKAETILNKIDQNAANVLNQSRDEIADVEQPLIEISVTSNKKKHLQLSSSTSSLLRTNNSQINNDETKSKSKSSSRRSSFSSKQDTTSTVIDVFEQNPITFTAHPTTTTITSATSSESSNQNTSTNTLSIDQQQELSAMKIMFTQMKSERDELRYELDSVVNKLNNHDNENRIRELEDLVNILSDEKEEIQKRNINIENTNSKYIKSISELESTISKHLQNESELTQKLQLAKMETEHAVTELEQYRKRAQSTLQLKEKMIEKLKQSEAITDNHNNNSHHSNNNEKLLNIELEQLRYDRETLREELNKLRENYEQSKLNFAAIETRFRTYNCDLEEKVTKLQSNLNQETTKNAQLADDLKIQCRELQTVREELIKQKVELTKKLYEREMEVMALKNRTQNRSASPATDIEERLHSLTQSLVQKQTSLESLVSERNALRLQLEKISQQNYQQQYQSGTTQRSNSSRYMNTNETDDAKSAVPNFLIENPFDNRVARRVKRAYSSLDEIGIRLGVFMRRYPLFRILVIFYVILLHLWVVFVLFSSTPT
uniref:Putative golgin-84 n=1 Tax=Corethrella appendiculata TaxID=1370023 RepID=U5EYS1_9DIPT